MQVGSPERTGAGAYDRSPHPCSNFVVRYLYLSDRPAPPPLVFHSGFGKSANSLRWGDCHFCESSVCCSKRGGNLPKAKLFSPPWYWLLAIKVWCSS